MRSFLGGGKGVLLLVGPITSWGTILVLGKKFGGGILAVCLVVVYAMSLVLGYWFPLIWQMANGQEWHV